LAGHGVLTALPGQSLLAEAIGIEFPVPFYGGCRTSNTRRGLLPRVRRGPHPDACYIRARK
jgi:hypothetical protein